MGFLPIRCNEDAFNLLLQIVVNVMNFVLSTTGNIDEERRETYDIERSIANMQNDMIKLNTLLNKEHGTHDNLHQDNALLENDFVLALKEAEMDSIELQANLDGMKEEKERLLNSLVEAESVFLLFNFKKMFDNNQDKNSERISIIFQLTKELK